MTLAKNMSSDFFKSPAVLRTFKLIIFFEDFENTRNFSLPKGIKDYTDHYSLRRYQVLFLDLTLYHVKDHKLKIIN